jgi:drug/metabolite transporter (DMT)-like permease
MNAAPWATALATVGALVAFAGNSLLTRLALAPPAIDAGTFSVLRLAAGAAVLALVAWRREGHWRWLRSGRAVAPLALAAYAVPFTIAYLRIGAATGALVLFGTVQLTMVGVAIAQGERPRAVTALGLGLAAGGLVAFTRPSAAGTDGVGVALMALAGAAWGAYTLLGRGSGPPIVANAFAFTWSVPIALACAALLPRATPATPRGVLLALASGAVTSGLGYAVWYRALRGLSATTAAAVQLAVPMLAALGGVLLLGESLTPRQLAAGSVVLGGIALVLVGRARPARG